jgi:hypothetical protein
MQLIISRLKSRVPYLSFSWALRQFSSVTATGPSPRSILPPSPSDLPTREVPSQFAGHGINHVYFYELITTGKGEIALLKRGEICISRFQRISSSRPRQSCKFDTKYMS